MRKTIILGMVLALCVMAAGCEMQQPGAAKTKPIAEWKALDWSTYWLGVYIHEKALYDKEKENPAMMTASRAAVLRVKNQAFNIMYEPMMLFAATVDAGGVPPPNLWERVIKGSMAVAQACGVTVEIPPEYEAIIKEVK